MATFGLRYFAQLRSKYKGVFWRVEIAERDYSGPSEEMEFAGGSTLGITWENRGDEFYVPVKASEATINVMCHDNFHFIGLFTSDPRKWRVSIYRNTVLYWRGFVVAHRLIEPDSMVFGNRAQPHLRPVLGRKGQRRHHL